MSSRSAGNELADRARGLVAITRRVISRFGRDACAGRAAGLAFSTIFALVPLIAVVVAVLSLFGVFETLVAESRQSIVEELVPAVSDQVIAGIAEFSQNARALGFFGFLVFLITAVVLIRGVHASLNAIWRFRSESRIWGRVSTYTTVIVLGTLLLAGAVAVGPLVQSLIDVDPALLSWTSRLSELLLPPLLLFATLFLMTILVPSGRVQPGSAAIGALVATIGWEIAKRIFVFWTGSVMRLSVIYGSLAAVPIFLIWVYITWLIVLAGVEVAYVHQHRNEPRNETGADEPVAALPDLSEYTVRAISAVLVRFRDGMPPLTQHDLDDRYGATTAEGIRDALVASGLVLETDVGFVPSRSLSRITVDDVARGLWTSAGEEPVAKTLLTAWAAERERPAVDVLADYFR
jgi:membrane protein